MKNEISIWTLPLDGTTYILWCDKDGCVKNRALTEQEHDFLFKHKDLYPIMQELITMKEFIESGN